MYKIPETQKSGWTSAKLDYMQLGLTLAYVLLFKYDEAKCPDYHEMQLDEMPPTIKNDLF